MKQRDLSVGKVYRSSRGNLRVLANTHPGEHGQGEAEWFVPGWPLQTFRMRLSSFARWAHSEGSRKSGDLIKELFAYLGDAKVCLCFTCSHQPAYGPCEACGCKNLPYQIPTGVTQ